MRIVATLSLIALAMTCAATARAQAADDADIRRLLGSDTWKTDFSKRSVPLEEIVSGGPPKDGIPAIDRPRFESVAEAGRWLKARDPILVVEHGGTVKGYPLAILIQHEIVNDHVAGRLVAVTYCPLCNTAIVFDRRLDGRPLDFGTTGRLRHSDLVMYDRQTETWWQQATGEAIVGELTGTKLSWAPALTLGWNDARSIYPEMRVLSRDTGYPRSYGRNPYVGYDNPRGGPIRQFFRGPADPRLPAMERVVAVDRGDGWAAPFSELAEVRAINTRIAGDDAVVFWQPGAASAVDQAEIASSRDVGQTAVFERRLAGGRVLSFEAVHGGFRDRETGSLWNIAGHATAGPLAGQRLRPIPHNDPFWFAWITFRPETTVWRK